MATKEAQARWRAKKKAQKAGILKFNFREINEDTYKFYLLRCVNEHAVDIKICTEIRNYLDKKKAIQQQAPEELDADFAAANASITAD